MCMEQSMELQKYPRCCEYQQELSEDNKAHQNGCNILEKIFDPQLLDFKVKGLFKFWFHQLISNNFQK